VVSNRAIAVELEVECFEDWLAEVEQWGWELVVNFGG